MRIGPVGGLGWEECALAYLLAAPAVEVGLWLSGSSLYTRIYPFLSGPAGLLLLLAAVYCLLRFQYRPVDTPFSAAGLTWVVIDVALVMWAMAAPAPLAAGAWASRWAAMLGKLLGVLLLYARVGMVLRARREGGGRLRQPRG